MATLLELQWLGLDAAASTNTNSDPATGSLQTDQLNAINEVLAVLLTDSDGSAWTYALSTVFSTRYRAVADFVGAVPEYKTGDIIHRVRTCVYTGEELTTVWYNITQSLVIAEPVGSSVLALSTELITQHTDQREISLPGINPEIQSRVYTIDIISPAVIASDTGWR